MSAVELSKSSLELLLSVKRQIRVEFNDVFHLSDDQLLLQLNHYWQKSESGDTRALLERCLHSLGSEVIPIIPEPVPRQVKRIYRGQIVWKSSFWKSS